MNSGYRMMDSGVDEIVDSFFDQFESEVGLGVTSDVGVGDEEAGSQGKHATKIHVIRGNNTAVNQTTNQTSNTLNL